MKHSIASRRRARRKRGSACARADGLLEIVCKGHYCVSCFFRLAFFGTAANKDHEPVAIHAEVNAVAGSEIDLVFVNTGADAPHVS
jgi:hypothetical protein